MTYKIGHDDTQIFEFSPVPFIQCDTAFDLSGKEETGQTITINVSGTLVAPRHLENEGIRDENATNVNHNVGLVGMSPLERLRRKMEQILSVPGGEFKIYCICGEGDCEDVTYFKIYPQMIGNISFQNSSDNWTQTIPYTFQIVVHRTDLFNKDGQPIYLESIDENWSMELVDEKVFPSYDDLDFKKRDAASTAVMRLTHTLNATGKKVYGEQEFGAARGGQSVHEFRRDKVNASITEYDISHSEERYNPVNTNAGNIKTPYQEGNLQQVPVNSKIHQAEQLFKRLTEGNYFHRRADTYIKDLVTHSRACDVLAAESSTGIPNLAKLDDKKDDVRCSLNIIPVSKSIRRQVVEGIIAYSYEFNTKCANLFADTLMESISTNITYPTDVFTNVIIPGRQKGPLFFSANTQQAPKYTLNIELVLKPECPTGAPLVMPLGDPTRHNPIIYNRVRARLATKHNCRDRMITIARAHYDYIKTVMGDIIKIEADGDTWNESEGRYSGNITFVFGRCHSKQAGDWLQTLTKTFNNADELQSAS